MQSVIDPNVTDDMREAFSDIINKGKTAKTLKEINVG